MTPTLGLLVTLIVVCPPLLWLVERQAIARGVLDRPNERSSHQRPTPRGGGIAIVLGTIAGTWVFVTLAGVPVPPQAVAALGAALVVGLVSLADDIRSLSPLTRLAVHLAAGLVVIAVVPAPREVTLPVYGRLDLGDLAAPLGLLWLVGLTNVYNFMDGIDGLAAGQAIVAGLAWAALGRLVDAPLVEGLGLGLAGSSAFFLARNWPPARLFMGDAGSAYLGANFALLPLVLPLATADPGIAMTRAFAAGAVSLWPFLFDATLTLLSRASRRENILLPHRRHLYQRMVQGGYSHARVSLLYIALAAAGAVAGVGWAAGRAPGWPALAVPALGGAGLLMLARRPGRGAQRV